MAINYTNFDKQQNILINRYNLTFSDKEIEKKYKSYMYHSRLTHFRIGVIVCIIMLVGGFFADYYVDHHLFITNIPLRIIESTFLFFIFLTTFLKNFKRFLNFLLVLAIISIDLFLLLYTQHIQSKEIQLIYISADILILISTFFVFGLNFAKALLLALTSFTILILSLDFMVEKDQLLLYFILFSYVIFLSSIGSYFIELNNRKSFLQKLYTKKLLKKLKKTSRRDPLTQLYNRLGFDEIFNTAMDTHRVREIPFGVLLIDIDNFKNINDTYGHLSGDKILKSISSILQTCTQDLASVCRWGGEEFFILIPECNIEKIKMLSEKIIDKIRSHTFDDVGYCSVSIGTTLVTKEDTKISLIQRVDQALYKAKAKGKDRIIHA